MSTIGRQLTIKDWDIAIKFHAKEAQNFLHNLNRTVPIKVHPSILAKRIEFHEGNLDNFQKMREKNTFTPKYLHERYYESSIIRTINEYAKTVTALISIKESLIKPIPKTPANTPIASPRDSSSSSANLNLNQDHALSSKNMPNPNVVSSSSLELGEISKLEGPPSPSSQKKEEMDSPTTLTVHCDSAEEGFILAQTSPTNQDSKKNDWGAGLTLCPLSPSNKKSEPAEQKNKRNEECNSSDSLNKASLAVGGDNNEEGDEGSDTVSESSSEVGIEEDGGLVPDIYTQEEEEEDWVKVGRCSYC